MEIMQIITLRNPPLYILPLFATSSLFYGIGRQFIAFYFFEPLHHPARVGTEHPKLNIAEQTYIKQPWVGNTAVG